MILRTGTEHLCGLMAISTQVGQKDPTIVPGGWVDGQKTGYGEYFYKNGDSYKGQVRILPYFQASIIISSL